MPKTKRTKSAPPRLGRRRRWLIALAAALPLGLGAVGAAPTALHAATTHGRQMAKPAGRQVLALPAGTGAGWSSAEGSASAGGGTSALLIGVARPLGRYWT